MLTSRCEILFGTRKDEVVFISLFVFVSEGFAETFGMSYHPMVTFV